MRRLLLSLRAVNTTLPVFVMTPNRSALDVGGARWLHRHADAPPAWSHSYHRPSFYKLNLLSLTRFSKIISLDTDVQVVRNLDHLCTVQAPAFVVHRPDHGINSGVQVLTPSTRAYRAAQLIIKRKSKRSHDGSDQEVIRELYATFYELPLKYNGRPHFRPVGSNMCEMVILHKFDHREHSPTVARTLYLNECT